MFIFGPLYILIRKFYQCNASIDCEFRRTTFKFMEKVFFIEPLL